MAIYATGGSYENDKGMAVNVYEDTETGERYYHTFYAVSSGGPGGFYNQDGSEVNVGTYLELTNFVFGGRTVNENRY